jgi:Sortase domain
VTALRHVEHGTTLTGGEDPPVGDGPTNAAVQPRRTQPSPTRIPTIGTGRFWARAGIAAVGMTAAVCTALALTGGPKRPPVPPVAAAQPPIGSSRSAAATTGTAPSVSASTVQGRIPALPRPEGPAHSALPVSHAAIPVEVTIPAIGVDSPLEALGLNSDGSLAKPSQWQVAGWYAGGVRPGDDGPAVIAGHVDSVSGPAVFYRLRDLRRGAVVFIREANGTTLRFVVDSSVSYPKDRFPSAAVYGPAAVPVLRLVTCTGDFDWQAKSYVDNLVVTAYLG